MNAQFPSIEIGLQGLLTDLQRIDLFPTAKWHEGVESIVSTIDKRLIINPQEALVLCQSLLEGYNFLSLMRASWVVTRQWTVEHC